MFNTEQFISKSREIHNNKFDYSKSVYNGSRNKVKIICPIHGEFETTAGNHLRGFDCKLCSNTKLKPHIPEVVPQEIIISRFREKHRDKFDYSKVTYTGLQNKVVIVCPIHGEFSQTPNNHLKYGCGICSRPELEYLQKGSQETFLKKAREIHGNFYNYNLVEYKNYFTPVVIICPAHGLFKQKPNEHISKKANCPRCIESKGERFIADWLFNRKIEFIKQFTNSSFNSKKRFDFYLPDHDLYIEYDGEFHYKPIMSTKHLAKQQERDQKRNKWCKENNINLLVIAYLDSIEEKLNTLLG